MYLRDTRHSLKMVGAALAAIFLLSACETTPEPEPYVFDTEPEPTVDISEMNVEIYEEPEPIETVDVNELSPEEFEALMGYPKPGSEPEVPEDAPVKPPKIKLTPLQLAAKAQTPDRAIKILSEATMSADVKTALDAAYTEKLDVDLANGNNKGAAQAMVYLAKLDLQDTSKAGQIGALKKFIRASETDPENEEASAKVESLRKGLKSYAGKRHKEAVSFFVAQDFSAAARIWEDVLVIDPNNSAAANWYKEAKASSSR